MITLPTLTLPGGDTKNEGVINIPDILYIGGRYLLNCGEVGWNDEADINVDCTVNAQDVVLAGGNYLSTAPVEWPQVIYSAQSEE